MEGGKKRAEMRELGASSQVQKLNCLRQFQQRRRGEQEIVGERDDGADRAVGGVPVGIGAGRLLLCGCGVRLWCSQGGGSGLRQPTQAPAPAQSAPGPVVSGGS